MTKNWVFLLVFASICFLPCFAQNANMIGTIQNNNSLLTFTYGERILGDLLLTPGFGLGNFSLTKNYTYSFVTLPTLCSSPSLFTPVAPNSPTNITVDITTLLPGTYYLCFEGVLQTTVSPWLVIKEGGGNLQAYYWCGNWTAQVLSGVLPPIPAQFPFPSYVALPNSFFPSANNNETDCILVFECDYCNAHAQINNNNTDLEIFLQTGAYVIEPRTFGFSFSANFKLKESDDVVISIQTRGAGSNSNNSSNIKNSTFTFRLLAPVIYKNLQGDIPACSRQTEDLTLTVQFGRDVPGGAALLLFFPLGVNLYANSNLTVLYGENNSVWQHTLQSTQSTDFFILPLLGKSNENSVIHAYTDVRIFVQKGSLTATNIYPITGNNNGNEPKIFLGFYFPLLTQPDGSIIPVDFAVNPTDLIPESMTFAQNFVTVRDNIHFTPVQSARCDSSFFISFFTPFSLNENDTHFLFSFSPEGSIEFSNNSLSPLSFLPLSPSSYSLQGEEISLFTDTRYQQLFSFSNYSSNNNTKNVCTNITLMYTQNSTFCSSLQTPGESVSNFSLLILTNKSTQVYNFSSFLGEIFISSPAPTHTPTPPTFSPTTQTPTQAARPCPSQTEYVRIYNNNNISSSSNNSITKNNLPSCEISCNFSNIYFYPAAPPNTTLLCGLSDPSSLSSPSPSLSSLSPSSSSLWEGKNPPEPDIGQRLTEVVDIYLVDSEGRYISVPSPGAQIIFTLPLLDTDEVQHLVWRAKNIYYVTLNCAFFNRTQNIWSTNGCSFSSLTPFPFFGPTRKGGVCVCEHTTEFTIIAAYVTCKAEYAEWGLGALYSLCTFFSLIELVRILMHPRGDNNMQSGNSKKNCDILLIFHFLLVVVGVLRAVCMFIRCSMTPEIRVFLASLPFAIFLLQFFLIVLLWAGMGVFSLEQNPFLRLKWVFVVVSVLMLLFTFAMPGLVVFDTNQDGHSVVTVYASWAFGALDCVTALLVVCLGSRLACVLRQKDLGANTGFGKFTAFSVLIGIFLTIESVLWALTIDEYSLVKFGFLDTIYHVCDLVVFLLFLFLFTSAVTLRSKTQSHSVLTPHSQTKNSLSNNNNSKVVSTPRKAGGRTSLEMSRNSSKQPL